MTTARPERGPRLTHGKARTRQLQARPATAGGSPIRVLRAAGSEHADRLRPSTTEPGAAPARPGGLTESEVQRAAEIEAAMVAEERAAEVSRKRSQERLAVARELSATRDMNLAQEYAYVSRDLRDIARIAVVMLTILFGLWIVIDVLGVITIT